MVAGAFSVGVTPTVGSLSVNQFYATPPATPGNVGVSLSDGGSRALTAGMGQLRALNKLTVNGPVTSRAGKGAFHGFRWIMAWRAVHLSPTGIAERRSVSRPVDRGSGHSHPGDPVAATCG